MWWWLQDLVALLAGLLIFGWWLVDWVRFGCVLDFFICFIILDISSNRYVWYLQHGSYPQFAIFICTRHFSIPTCPHYCLARNIQWSLKIICVWVFPVELSEQCFIHECNDMSLIFPCRIQIVFDLILHRNVCPKKVFTLPSDWLCSINIPIIHW